MASLFNVPPNDSSSASEAPLAHVQGTLERVTFHNEENGYTIARLLPQGAREPFTITGSLPHPVIGSNLILHGRWNRHPQWGAQFSIVRYEVVRPATPEAIEKYLGSGMVKGVGPVTAKRIVEQFGDRALDVIEQTPDELLKVPGLGAKTLDVIKVAWLSQRDVRSVMVFLQSHGISPTYAARIYKRYGDQSIEKVERNPYRLANDIWGIGFLSADRIAETLGFQKDDPRRLQAGVAYVLGQAVESGGHVYLPRNELVQSSERILGRFDIARAVDALLEMGALVEELVEPIDPSSNAIYLPQLHAAEKELADRIKFLVVLPVATFGHQPTMPLSGTEGAYCGPELTAEQVEAVRLTLTSRVSVITGGPGVGKTTTTRAVVNAFRTRGKTVLLASPTGRAAKRLSEVTGAAALTIHRLLAYDPQKREFQRNAESPLDCDLLLIDESSMLDTLLAASLLASVPNTAQVVFVGDVDQLPSVGPGSVLRNIIDSDVVPVARLQTVFRQASQSMIVIGAHAINVGTMPRLARPQEQASDFVFVEVNEADEIAGKVVAIVQRSLPRRGYTLNDVQVLAPMQRGSAGSAHLNERLQDALNPALIDKPEIRRGQRLFRLGDRVIQMRNNYDKAVYNGDIGSLIAIDIKEQTLTVSYDGRSVLYEAADIEELALAYSLSVHKSQGSEFPVAVIVLHTQHFALLQRNLVYTALTRAKKLAVLVGSKKALAMAVANNRQAARHTRLKWLLQEHSQPSPTALLDVNGAPPR